jgi:hypothetical protein
MFDCLFCELKKRNMIKHLIAVLLAFLSFATFAQAKVTLNGYVKDSGNGEELIGVTVYIPQIQAGTSTNSYGFYSITMPPGTYEVHYSFVGFKTQVVSLELTSNVSRNVELISEATVIEEVVVEGTPIDENIVNVQMSRNRIDINRVRKLPALFGEVDIIKNIQMLPGVVSAGEGTSSFYVRGGSADQNLILIDEAPVYDPSHLFGLFSVFNADVIKESELYKGGIPSRFGGRLSSILEVRTKDGNNKEFHGAGGIGSMASRIMVEGPIRKDKSSFIISGRRSYADLFLRAADEQNLVYFYDINAKVNWKHNNNNRFFAAVYAGRDDFSFDDDFGFTWGNATATFRWNHLFNDRLFSNTTLIASNFDYALEVVDPVEGLEWTSNLQEISLKNDLSYFLNLSNELSFGYHVTGRRFSPGKIVGTGERSIFDRVELQKLYALDHALYISNQQRINEKLTLDYGARLSIFQSMGPGDLYLYEDPKDNLNPTRIDTLQFDSWQNIKTYVNLEPRLAFRYVIKSGQALKLSYNRMVQNTHLISAGTVPVPFNTWNPSGYYLKPQIADQVAAGYFRNFRDNMFEFSVEAYYKDMDNVTDFADNAQLFFNEDLSTEFRQGDSWSYGAEVMLDKKEGRLTGMISYTWSQTQRHIEGVNLGKRFYANYDRRHVLNINAAYDLNERWSFGANFNFSTGRPITLPTGKYEYGIYNPDVISERNGYRLPDYNRLDLSATLTPRRKGDRKWQGQWVFSVYNVYNQQNPFTIYTRTKQDDDGNVIGDGTQKEARLVYLFPVLPSVTYNFKF